MKNEIQKIVPHFFSVLIFIGLSVIFFYPILQNKTLLQSDIVQYTGMAKERNDLRSQGHESYWTDSAFAGMPTYQLGAQYSYDFVKKIDKAIRFLPRPSDYLFLYFIGFYILLLVMRVEVKTAIVGALAFGFSTYLIIILGVGHNAKAHAIGYFAPVLAGFLLVFDKKYLWGGFLTALALALEINANHYQMTYYLLLLILLLSAFKLYYAIKAKKAFDFAKSLVVLFVASVIAILSNALPLMTTQEYAKWSTRGTSSLTISPEGSSQKTTTGLSYEYITEYSYGISESLNLVVPRLFGGSNSEALGKDSQTYHFLRNNGVPTSQALNFADNLPTYWGGQPIVAAPAYIGAVVLFLFVLALFIVKNNTKRWLLIAIVLSLLLSWGKNFAPLTNFMIEYFPLYNKFRAVSSIQVLLELCIPILASIGLYHFLISPSQYNKKALKHTLYICLGLMLTLLLGKGLFSFSSTSDALLKQYYGQEIIAMIIEDRKAMYTADILRSSVFIVLTFSVLYLFHLGKIKKEIIQITIALLLLFDLAGVAKRYVSKEDFVDKRQMEAPFPMTKTDAQILKDTTRYRVYEPTVGINGARTSYFHKSIGGYHAAKPQYIQNIFDYQIYKGNMKMFDMLNVKYFITQDEKGQTELTTNTNALGNAWFVSQLKAVASEDEMMQRLSDFNPKTEAILFDENIKNQKFTVDSTATIKLLHNTPDELQYETNNPHNGFAVFSEAHYPHGWQATIDGKKTDFYRVNYMLRGMYVPQGKHIITFTFNPPIVRQASLFSVIGFALLLLWLIVAIRSEYVKCKAKNN